LLAGLRIGVAVARALVSSHVGWARANMWSGYGELGALGSGCVGWGKAGRVRVRLVFLEGVYVWVVRSKR
jgi:hypothetical protein